MSATVRDHLKVCAFTIILLAFASQSRAADYYVDYAAGSDLNAGNSASAPWQHCPGDSALISSADTTFVTATNYSTSSSGTSATWNLTLQTDSVRGYLLVATQQRYGGAVTNVTWGGANLALLGSSSVDSGGGQVQFWGIPTGTTPVGTYTIGVGLNGSTIFAGSAMLFTGVNQTNSIGPVAATNSNVITLTVPPSGYGVIGLATYLGAQDAAFGNTVAYQNSSGVKLTVASSTKTGTQTFGFSSSGYPESTLALSLLIDAPPGPGSTQLQPGDVVHFKGGVPYVLTGVAGNGGINVSQSGTKSAPITYDGNYSGAWGTGKALITDNFGTNNRIAFYYAFGTGSNTVIKNFDIGRMGGAAVIPPDTGSILPGNYAAGVYAEVGFQHVTIADCYFHELGYWQNFKPVGNSSIGGHGIRAAGAGSGQAYETDGLVITNCEITKVRNPIQIQAYKLNNHIDISHCYIHGFMEWCMDLAYVGDGVYWDNMSVHDNIFEDYDVYYGNSYWTGYQAAPHQNGIYWRADVHWNIAATNINFYNNTFRATIGGYAGGTSALYLEGPAQANIYNNVFSKIQPANACIVLQMFDSSPATTNLQANIFNNTFDTVSPNIYFAGWPDHSYSPSKQWWPPTCQVYVTNNIFLNQLTNAGYQFILLFDCTNMTQVATQSFHLDYNDYLINNNQHPRDLIGNQNGNWVMFQAYGWEAHGQTNDPLVSTVATGGYQLAANSPVINAGVNLTALGWPGVANDKNGYPRPPVGPWTLGAYAPIGSSGFPYVSLVASTNTIINGQSVLLTWASINATNVFLTGVGQVVPSGSLTVSPTLKTTYVITATGTNGTQSASAAITVRPSPPILIPLH